MERSNRTNWWVIGIVAAVAVILLSCIVAAFTGGMVAMLIARGGDDAREYMAGPGIARDDEECDCPMMGGMEGKPTPGGGMMMMGGAMVLTVVPGSPAEEAGLMPGDVIVAVDSRKVGQGTELADVIAGYAPGDRVSIEFRRGAATNMAVVVLAQSDDPSKPRLGIEYRTMPMMGDTDDSNNGDFD